MPTTPTLIPDDREPTPINPKDELLRWHYRLSHMAFSRLRQMCEIGDLPRRLLQAKTPFCAACQYGKLTRRPWRTKGQVITGVKVATHPGQVVSVDQLESPTAGFVAQLKGAPTLQRYRYATIFVDHYSRYVYVYLQKSLTSAETVQAKCAFENNARDHGVRVLHYHADNGRFADNGFINDCKIKGQGLSYCGGNAHFQNGIAEKMIRDLQEGTRTSLLFAIQKWPKMVNVHLWPYGLRHDANVRNATATIKHKKSPLELWSQVQVAPKIRHFHTFGCPVYVLDNKLQAQQGVPKWKSRARLGVYLGASPTHARSVSLVLNPRTAHVSPQFHVKYDDFFETVSGKSTDFDQPEPEWKYLSRLYQRTVKKPKDNTPSEGGGFFRSIRVPNVIDPRPQEEGNSTTTEIPQVAPTQQPTNPPEPAPTPAPGQVEPAEPAQAPTPTVHQTRSGRVVKPTQRYLEGLQQRRQGLVAWEILLDQEGESPPTTAEQFEIQSAMENPVAFAATADPDTMYLHEAMRQPDREQFMLAMQKEINDHEIRKHWEVVPKSQVPKGTKVIDMVWSMKRKRRIDTREIYKWKARLNVHGGQQEYGLNYWETYSPVVGWTTLRFFFILALLRGWHCRQLDFVLAFPQAPTEVCLYMNFPKGYQFRPGISKETHVLKLLRNIYGTKQGPRVWNKYLDQGLRGVGFTPSKIDPCLYYKGDVIFLVYIDDCVLMSPSNDHINQVIKDLENAKETFTVEDLGLVTDFLGVKVDFREDGTIKLSQSQLIASVLKDLHLQGNTKARQTPALQTVLLHKDPEGDPFNEEFHYRSVIGKLNFLEKSTRPDISYAVHQCARFSSNPKQSHGLALKRIGKYLKGTADQGIIFKPDPSKSFHCWVDADFAGNWHPDYAATDPMTSKSRSGWAITYANCPIAWASKMQTLTALSTTEAEYLALSTALRELIPLMELTKEVREHEIHLTQAQPKVHCKVFEDNSGALEMARLPKIRPRTKHINNQYHHFRDHVQRGEIEIQAIATEDQIADMLTKALPVDLYTKFRAALQTW
ncbi:hypothetical protein ACA910_005738 [Epithemia clementina (nom. ined.)]